MRKRLSSLMGALSLATILFGCANVLNDHSPIKPGELRKRLDPNYAKNHPPNLGVETKEDRQRQVQYYEQFHYRERYKSPGIERVVLWGVKEYITNNYIPGDWQYDLLKTAEEIGDFIERHTTVYLGNWKAHLEAEQDQIWLNFSVPLQ